MDTGGRRRGRAAEEWADPAVVWARVPQKETESAFQDTSPSTHKWEVIGKDSVFKVTD